MRSHNSAMKEKLYRGHLVQRLNREKTAACCPWKVSDIAGNWYERSRGGVCVWQMCSYIPEKASASCCAASQTSAHVYFLWKISNTERQQSAHSCSQILTQLSQGTSCPFRMLTTSIQHLRGPFVFALHLQLWRWLTNCAQMIAFSSLKLFNS